MLLLTCMHASPASIWTYCETVLKLYGCEWANSTANAFTLSMYTLIPTVYRAFKANCWSVQFRELVIGFIPLRKNAFRTTSGHVLLESLTIMLVTLCLCKHIVSVNVRVCSLTTPGNHTQIMLHQCEYQQCKRLKSCLPGQKKQCQSGAQMQCLQQALNRSWTVQTEGAMMFPGPNITHMQGVELLPSRCDVHIHSRNCKCDFAPNQAWPHFVLPT